MSNQEQTGDPDPAAWRRALDAAASAHIAAGALQVHRATTLASLDAALRGTLDAAVRATGDCLGALLLLNSLDPSYTLALVDVVVDCALSQRDASLCRQLLGRVAHHQVAEIVPAEVFRLLDVTDDDDAYRRMAELLRHLGLITALGKLRDQALASDDPYVQEVGNELGESMPDSA